MSASMKVGVIASELEGERTGVGRYLEGLLRGLEQWDHGVEWHLFLSGPPGQVLPTDDRRVVSHVSDGRGSRVVWEQLRLPRELARHDLDVVFGPGYSLPVRLSQRAVVTLHDLSFELLPDEFHPRERWRRRALARWSVRKAERVLTDTDSMAQLVAARYGLPVEKLAVVPLAIDRKRFSALRDPSDVGVVAEVGARPPYLLWVGTVLERRQPQEVLTAFAALRKRFPDLQLVIAGANRLRTPSRLAQWVHELGLGESVVMPGWVEEGLLAPLYRLAVLGIYVSRHEGFGIPPLECLACGTPVVVSQGLALDDLWPDYPYRCQETSVPELEEMASRILEGSVQAGAVVAHAREVLAGLDWESSSRRLVAELAAVAGR